MRIAAIISLLLCALPSGSLADKTKVNRAIIEVVEKSIDARLQKLWPGDPSEVIGLTQGAYINGYGPIFMCEVNLALATGITPFHPSVTPDEIKRTHEKKVQRMAALRAAMRDILVDSAASLDSVSSDDQIALGVSLFYWTWENREGLPAQIVMHAPKKLLLQAKTGAFDKSLITADEY